MRYLNERLVMIMTLSFLALAVTQGEPTSLVFAGIAAIVVSAALVARYAAIVVRSHDVGTGERAREHRQSLEGMPEPQHPETPGRPRTRAPSRGIAAA